MMSIVTTRFGTMRIIDADRVVSRSLSVYGEWAMDELNLLSQLILPGMRVLDVGAYIGTHTLAFSQFVGSNGRVYAFEPRREIHEILSENILLNNLENVVTLNVGVGEENQDLSLRSLDINQAANFGGLNLQLKDNLSDSESYEIKILKIDSLEIGKIDVIKVDVEGMETLVLRGSMETVHRDRPIFFSECNSLQSGDDMLEFCKETQYEAYGHLATAYNANNFNASLDNIFSIAKEFALILIPNERVNQVTSSISGVTLLPIKNLDDLVLPLLHKPQYAYEVLAHTASYRSLGIDFPSPAMFKGDLRDEKIAQLEQSLTSRDDLIQNLMNSKSWIITKPLRTISGVLSQKFAGISKPIEHILPDDNSGVLLSGKAPINLQKLSQENYLITRSPISPASNAVVILPVYRGVEMTKNCIISALPNVLALPGSRFVAINDASPDVGMQQMLMQFAGEFPLVFILLENDSNLGFVKTVNRGLRHFPLQDVVLLNSDVLVPNSWLSRLIDEAYSKNNIATVTPFSNNATICSFPQFLHENAPPFGLDIASIDAAFCSETLPCIGAPTGVGFCMYIRRACLDEIGYLNEKQFGRGYGEENDLCQRAQKHGWLNIISPNIYVHHEGGVSFSSDKSLLVERAMRVLDNLHPNYHGDIQSFIKADPVKSSRVVRYIKLLSSIKIPKVVHVSHSLGGGVAQHVQDLSKNFDSSVASILLSPHISDKKISLQLKIDDCSDELIFSIRTDYADLTVLLNYIGVSAVHYHHTHNLDPKILNLATDLGAVRLVTVHDYYWLNANPTLTDAHGMYPGFYSQSLSNPLYPLPPGLTLEEWQNRFRSFIETANCVIYPSNAAKKLFENVYIPASAIVAPHIEPLFDINRKPLKFRKKKFYTIGVLGALGREKGADVLEEIAKTASKLKLKLKFKLIGYAYRRLKIVEATGPYDAQDLKATILSHDIDIIYFPAQWPETYSYTLSCAIDCGLPIIAPALGAFPERLSGRKNVFLFNHRNSPADLTKQFANFIEKLSIDEVVNAPVFEYDESKKDFYSNEYVSLLTLFTSKKPDVSETLPLAIYSMKILSGSAHKNISWRGFLVRILWRIYMNPCMRWISYVVPYSLRRFVKRSLSKSAIHDITLKK